jgi:hypothetical protein
MSEEAVTITKAEYEKLVEESKLFNRLKCAGVDNWEGYDDAMSDEW